VGQARSQGVGDVVRFGDLVQPQLHGHHPTHLLLAGPSLSLPSMLALRGIMGGKKTLIYVALVVAAATVTGLIYGALT